MGQSLRVLLVEDERSIADNVIFALKREQMTVTWCDRCSVAMDEFHRTRPDIIILDVGLPDGDGFSWCRELRQTSHVPVIFLTAEMMK